MQAVINAAKKGLQREGLTDDVILAFSPSVRLPEKHRRNLETPLFELLPTPLIL